MIIDGHNHILTAGLYPGYERFIKEMTLGYFQSRGDLPVDRDPTEADWSGLEYLWEPIEPDTLIRDHPDVDKCTILAVAPSDYTRYEIRGTVDITGVTGVEGPKTIDKGCDYIAALFAFDDVADEGDMIDNVQGMKAAIDITVKGLRDPDNTPPSSFMPAEMMRR